MTLPTDSKARKNAPMARGLLDYFPDALAAVARLSQKGNDKHNPGEPLHWSREKSNDHADCIVRHLAERGTVDAEDGELHDVKVAWRALAMLQLALEAQGALPMEIGWVSWCGGYCPVEPHALVSVRLRDGITSKPQEASCWAWSHYMNGSDIIAYKVVK